MKVLGAIVLIPLSAIMFATKHIAPGLFSVYPKGETKALYWFMHDGMNSLAAFILLSFALLWMPKKGFWNKLSYLITGFASLTFALDAFDRLILNSQKFTLVDKAVLISYLIYAIWLLWKEWEKE